MKDGLRRLIFCFNGFQFFFSLLWWVPIFYEYQKRLGLSDPEIFKIQSWYYLIFCLLEIPTGFLADRLGYRFCLLTGSIALILANVLVPLFGNYNGFFVHFTLIALSRSFISGASSAYLYDALKLENAMEAYQEAEGRARAYSLIGKIICWGLVGVIMETHFTLPYWLTALNAVIGLGFALALPRIAHANASASSSMQSKATLTELSGVLIKSPYLILIMAQGVSIFVLTRIAQVNLFQPILESKGFLLAQYGLVMAGMTFVEAIGAYRSNWIRQYMHRKNAVSLLTVLICLSFLLLSVRGQQNHWATQGLTLFAFTLFSYAVGLSYPIQRKLMNDAIPDSRYRASLLSAESLLDRAVNSMVALVLGTALAAGHLNEFLQQAAGVSFVATLIIAFGIYVYSKKGEHHVSP